MNPTLTLLSTHRSIRKFADTPVADSVLQSILAAAQCASTSHHVQAYTLIRVDDKKNRKKIADLAGPQPWVEAAPVFLVFCADLTRLISVCDRQGKTAETGWTEQFIVATVDTAIMAQNLMVAAESLGLGGVFIGGIRNDPETVCSLLHIPDQAYPVFGMCLGYPDMESPVKPRFPLELVLKKDRFCTSDEKKEQNKALNTYDSTLRDYFLNRDTNLKDETWSSQMASFMSQIIRPHMKAFLEKKGFLHK